MFDELRSYDIIKVGAIGMGVSLAWIVRERILTTINEHRRDNGL